MTSRRFVPVLLAAVLLSILLSTLTTAGLTQLGNDNGEFYQGSFAGRIRGDIDGAVFAPPPELFPITIQSVEFAFHRPRDAGNITDTARVRVQIYAVEEGVPGELLMESEPQTFSGLDQWFSLPLPGLLALDEPASFMAAVKWESGDENEPAPSLATDSNLDAPQEEKDRLNLYHDANLVLSRPLCHSGFCPHSEFWGEPALVGFNMIRVTVDSPQIGTPMPATPTPTTGAPTPTATATLEPLPDTSLVYLPVILYNFSALPATLRLGDVPGEAVSYALTSGEGVANRCWPGVDNNLWVGREPADERGIMRSVIRFDLSAVPQDALLIEAGLRLAVVETGADTAPMTVFVHDVTRPWSRCPTWNILANAVGQSWGSLAIGPEVGVYSVDVTTLVRSWLRGDLPNNGLLLRGDEAEVGRLRGFVPTASSQEDLRPALIIRYRRP